MRKLLIGLLALFAIVPLFAEQADSSVIFKARFLKHELQSYEITQSTYTLRNKDTTALQQFRVKADVYISDSSAEGYNIRWHLYDFSINTDSRKLQQLVSLAKPVDVTCRASTVGELQEFFDWEDLSTCLDEGFKTILPEFATRRDSSSKQELSRLFDFRSSLEGVVLRTIRMFHQVYGLGYTLGEIVDVPSDLILPAVPEPVPGVIHKRLVKIDQEDGVAFLTSVAFPDAKALQQALKKVYQSISIPPYLLNQSITGSVVADIKTGWLLYTFEQREYGPENHLSGELLELKHDKLQFN